MSRRSIWSGVVVAVVGALLGVVSASGQGGAAVWDGQYSGQSNYTVHSSPSQSGSLALNFQASNGQLNGTVGGEPFQGAVAANGAASGTKSFQGYNCNWNGQFTASGGGAVSVTGNFTCTPPPGDDPADGTISANRTSAPAGTPPATQTPATQPQQQTDPQQCDKTERRIRALVAEIRKLQGKFSRAHDPQVRAAIRKRIAARRRRIAEVRRDAKRYCALRPVPG